MTDRPDPKDQAYAIAKLQASVDGAFDDQLMRSWFDAAWDLCAAMVGFVHPPFQVAERITVRADGSFRLSYQPSSEVKIYSGATLILVMPKTLQRSACDPALCECCFCCPLTAHYSVGEETCAIPPRFVQAVARLFAYIAENRGDAELDEHVLKKSGAFAFLAPDVTFVL